MNWNEALARFGIVMGIVYALFIVYTVITTNQYIQAVWQYISIHRGEIITFLAVAALPVAWIISGLSKPNTDRTKDRPPSGK
jgi:hypothetical protein